MDRAFPSLASNRDLDWVSPARDVYRFDVPVRDLEHSEVTDDVAEREMDCSSVRDRQDAGASNSATGRGDGEQFLVLGKQRDKPASFVRQVDLVRQLAMDEPLIVCRVRRTHGSGFAGDCRRPLRRHSRTLAQSAVLYQRPR